VKLLLLYELDASKLVKALNRYQVKKAQGGINREFLHLSPDAPVSQPYRSGNLETPVKPEHKGLMGQPDKPEGSMADKVGREPSITGSQRKSSESPMGVLDKILGPASAKTRPVMTNMGQPYERGLSGDPLGDPVEAYPVDKDDGATDLKRNVAEDPGRTREGSLGFGRSKFGLQRYMG